MAEAIGIASGLVALTMFAFQSSVSLHQAVASFQGHTQAVRDLQEQLTAFNEILKSLQEAVTDDTAGLACLKLPLLRSGKACKDFEALILSCTTHSGGPKTSWRDWAKLKYMGRDISGFKDMLAGYKSTITIALGDANLREAKITVSAFNDYKKLINNTKTDLEAHFQYTEERLEKLSEASRSSGEYAAEQERVEEEKESTRQCLAICAQISEHIDQVEPTLFENSSVNQDAPLTPVVTPDGVLPAKRVTANMLKEVRDNIHGTVSAFEKRLHITRRNSGANFTQSVRTTQEELLERKQAEEEKNTITQSLAICARAYEEAEKARVNVFEDVTAAEGANQTVVATLGDLVSAKRVTAGVGAHQKLGQMSDISLQHLTRDQLMARDQRATEQRATIEGFEDQYGGGYKLHPAKGRD